MKKLYNSGVFRVIFINCIPVFRVAVTKWILGGESSNQIDIPNQILGSIQNCMTLFYLIDLVLAKLDSHSLLYASRVSRPLKSPGPSPRNDATPTNDIGELNSLNYTLPSQIDVLPYSLSVMENGYGGAYSQRTSISQSQGYR
jgi:hypothetical protein